VGLIDPLLPGATGFAAPSIARYDRFKPHFLQARFHVARHSMLIHSRYQDGNIHHHE
jgi:hypothetical protein